MLKVKVISVSKKTKFNNFLVKIANERTVTVLGVPKTVRETFFIWLDQAVPANSEHDLDMNMFDVVVQPFNTKDRVTGDAITINLKYLNLKK